MAIQRDLIDWGHQRPEHKDIPSCDVNVLQSYHAPRSKKLCHWPFSPNSWSTRRAKAFYWGLGYDTGEHGSEKLFLAPKLKDFDPRGPHYCCKWVTSRLLL